MKYINKYEDFLFEYVNIPKVKLDSKDEIKINSLEELYSILEDFDIDLSIWSTGPYKSVEHLWNEIKEGECLLYNHDSELRREVNFVGAKIFYKDESGIKYFLHEEKAIFKDGRERVRDIWYSMAEKFKFGEDPKEALIRGMEEELDIVVDVKQFVNYNTLYFPSDGDYPGVKSFHTGYSFLLTLNDEQYNSDGYVEHQSDKDIYFVWREIIHNPNKK